MSELIGRAKRLGADYKTVVIMCRANPVCLEIAADVYGLKVVGVEEKETDG